MRTLAIGQRYRKMSSPSTVWEVIGHRTDGCGISHFRLISTADHTRTILIGEWALNRPDVFSAAAPLTVRGGPQPVT